MSHHRDLHWVSPHMKGPDVERLQNKLKVHADGDYGAITAAAVRRSKSLLGFPKDSLDDGASEFYQQILYGERKAPDEYAKTAVARAKAADAAKTDGQKAADWLLARVPRTERDGLNRGDWGLDKWQVANGHPPYSSPDQMGWPWCGVTCWAAYKYGAGVTLDGRLRSVDWISGAARAGTGGLFAVPIAHARKGDMLTLFGNEHVGMVREDYDGSGPIPTVEGNTAFADGSQSDGGALTTKSRNPGDVVTCARVRKEA